MKQIKKLPTISSLTGVGVIDLDCDGSRYHQIEIRLTNNGTGGALQGVVDVIDEMRIKVNSRTVRRLLGSQIQDITDINGNGYASHVKDNDTYLTIYFAEPWRTTPAVREALAWGTGDVSTLQIEFDYKSGATEVFMEGKAIIDYPVYGEGANRGSYLNIDQIVQVGQHTISASGAGRTTFTNLPLNMPYLRLHFFSDKIGEISVRNGGAVLIDGMTKEENNAIQTKLGFNPQSDVFSILFDTTQLVADAMPVDPAKQLRIDFEMLAGATAFDVVYEQLGKPGE